MKKNYERIVLLLLSALLSVGFLAGCNDADFAADDTDNAGIAVTGFV